MNTKTIHFDKRRNNKENVYDILNYLKETKNTGWREREFIGFGEV